MRWWSGLFLVLCASGASAQILSADVDADGYSFSIGPAATGAGFTVFITTFDGSSGVPLSDCVGNICTVSQELAPVVPGSNSYRADYLAATAQGVFEYGALAGTLPLSDGDQNGIADVLQRVKPGGFSFSATTSPHFDFYDLYLTSTISVTVNRSASQRVGTYSGSFSNAFQSAPIAGAFSLAGATGTVSYEIGGETISWSLSRQELDGSVSVYSGPSSIIRQGTDAIEIPGFALTDSGAGLSILTKAATLARVGSVFRGRVDVFDGEPETSWPDYTFFHVTIADNNDTDSDGLPDLVAVPEPFRGWLVASAALLIVGGRSPRRAWGSGVTAS